MADIAPALAQKLAKDFRTALEDSAQLARIAQLVAEGGGSYAAAGDFAWEAGTLLAAVFAQITGDMLPDGRMPPELAEQAIRPLLEADHQLIADLARQVQDNLNHAAGIGLKAQAAPLNTDRVNGIITKICAAENFDDVAWVLNEPVKNYSQAVVDDTLKVNVRFQGKSGLRPRVIRQAERKCCEWCSRLEGEYDYPHVPPDVYRRHERCRCTVDYDPGNGKIQNVHTKEWQSEEEYAKLMARKQLGLTSLAKSLAEHPKRLASFTPVSLKAKLEAEGLEVKPLKNGSLKNIPFADGGGYKVNFEDGGLLQYHPAARSHHGGAYYKISTGKGGTHRYDLEGNEIEG